MEHQHAIICVGGCPDPNCTDNYIGEPVGRLSERIVDQSVRNNKLHLFKHAN